MYFLRFFVLYSRLTESHICFLVIFFFFFYCFVSHRRLHSFPTRRSSDLAIVVIMKMRNKSQTKTPLFDHETFSQDRKSTRLNSSHVSISYAVFCLKKKNNIVLDV